MIKVGEQLNGWVVAGVYEWDNYYDCLLIRDGQTGYVRIDKCN